MRYKNIRIHIDAPKDSGRHEVARLIKQALTTAGAHVECCFPDEEASDFGFSETTIFIDLHVPKNLAL